jgi:hypothetical protein
MRLSTRFLLPAAGLALACGTIVWPRWLAPDRVDTCARPDVLSVTGLIRGSKPESENRAKLDADRIQYSEGLVPDEREPRHPMVFRMVRSYSVLKSAEHPLGLMPGRLEAERMRRKQLDVPGGPIPVQLVHTSGTEHFHVVAYAFLFGNEPVENPFLAQLAGTLRELRTGRRPLTVLIAGGVATPETAPRREALALRWIAAAWEHYRGLCIDGRPMAGGGAAPAPGANP